MDTSARTSDFWADFAPAFRADPRRADDEALNILLGLAEESTTVLDVGGGAGRFALALALNCTSVTVVDPSEAMLAQLRLAIEDEGLKNVNAVRSEWETAEVEPRDLVLCAHVVYGVAEIGRFVRKLEQHANRLVALVSFVDAPQSHVSSLWETVHGEPRVTLPALPELLNVLWDLDIYPDVVMMPSKQTRTFESAEMALEELTRRLFIGDNPVKEERLRAALPEALERTADGFVMAGAKPARQGVITWRTPD
jgi:SAM-dependent methyltransferase